MKEENKRCWNCWKYAALYTRGGACFNPEKFGLCKANDKIVGKQQTCENWVVRQPDRRTRRNVMTQLDALRESLAAIEQIIKEEDEIFNSIIDCFLDTE